MIILYGIGDIFEGGHGETKDLRVQWALEEIGLPYRVHGLDQTAGDLDSDEYRRISPFRQVPVIDAGAAGTPATAKPTFDSLYRKARRSLRAGARFEALQAIDEALEHQRSSRALMLKAEQDKQAANAG